MRAWSVLCVELGDATLGVERGELVLANVSGKLDLNVRLDVCKAVLLVHGQDAFFGVVPSAHWRVAVEGQGVDVGCGEVVAFGLCGGWVKAHDFVPAVLPLVGGDVPLLYPLHRVVLLDVVVHVSGPSLVNVAVAAVDCGLALGAGVGPAVLGDDVAAQSVQCTVVLLQLDAVVEHVGVADVLVQSSVLDVAAHLD